MVSLPHNWKRRYDYDPELFDVLKEMVSNGKRNITSLLEKAVIFLTVRYQIPLKAVIYRFYEEHHIDNIDKFIENYYFIKQILKEINIFRKPVRILYGAENDYVLSDRSTYQDMEKSFVTGNASKENILKDAEKLELDMNVIIDFLTEEDGGAMKQPFIGLRNCKCGISWK